MKLKEDIHGRMHLLGGLVILGSNPLRWDPYVHAHVALVFVQHLRMGTKKCYGRSGGLLNTNHSTVSMLFGQ